MREYRVGGSISDYQEDHLISLSFGDTCDGCALPMMCVHSRLNENDARELTLESAQLKESTLKFGRVKMKLLGVWKPVPAALCATPSRYGPYPGTAPLDHEHGLGD